MDNEIVSKEEIIEAAEDSLDKLPLEERIAASKVRMQHPVRVSVLYFAGKPLSAATFLFGLKVPLDKVQFADGYAFAPASLVGQIVVQHILKITKTKEK